MRRCVWQLRETAYHTNVLVTINDKILLRFKGLRDRSGRWCGGRPGRSCRELQKCKVLVFILLVLSGAVLRSVSGLVEF